MRTTPKFGLLLAVLGLLCLTFARPALSETERADAKQIQQAKPKPAAQTAGKSKTGEAESNEEMAARIQELETRLEAMGDESASTGFSSSKLHVAGLGGWGYGRTDGNNYVLGSKEGSYDYHQFALAVSAAPSDRLNIKAQIYSGTEIGAEMNSSTGVGLDYAFARWSFNDNVAMVAGQIKHPFGIYTEILDVGTLRPFQLLPLSVYGHTGMAAESFFGGGLVLAGYTDSGWEVHVDAYGGQIPLEIEVRHAEEADTMAMGGMEDMEEMESEVNIRDAVGGRLQLVTPVMGLSVGASGYTGMVGGVDDMRFKAYGAQLEYIAYGLTLRSEVARHNRGQMTMTGYYVETSYRFGMTPWQVAGRYDHTDHHMDDFDLDERFAKNDEAAVGLNYWINENFVLKSSYHNVQGNIFTSPVEGETTEPKETNAMSLGVAFTF
jgi:hypothetical protein